MKASARNLLVPKGQHDRSLARSAWERATPKEPSRRVRYDSCRCARRFEDWGRKFRRQSVSRIEMIPKCIGGVLDHVRYLVPCYLWHQLRPIIPYPTGRFFRRTLSQALRAWLRSACHSGTKPFAHRGNSRGAAQQFHPEPGRTMPPRRKHRDKSWDLMPD